jgi:hypothetical protein
MPVNVNAPPVPPLVDRYGQVASSLVQEFDWLPAVVIIRVVRRAAVTLALVTGEEPDPQAVGVEARERLARASLAVMEAAGHPVGRSDRSPGRGVRAAD